MATLTRSGTAAITPALVLGWDSGRAARTVVHDVLDGLAPAVTLRTAQLRTGTLSLFFLTQAEAANAEARHAEVGVWTLTATEAPYAGMRYVVANGDVRMRAEGEDLSRWVVEVPFQEVQP